MKHCADRCVQYTLFANSSLHGTPTVRALFFEFPDEPELFGVDQQFLVGRDILVTPVLTPNVSSVDGTSPSNGVDPTKLNNSPQVSSRATAVSSGATGTRTRL